MIEPLSNIGKDFKKYLTERIIFSLIYALFLMVIWLFILAGISPLSPLSVAKHFQGSLVTVDVLEKIQLEFGC